MDGCYAAAARDATTASVERVGQLAPLPGPPVALLAAAGLVGDRHLDQAGRLLKLLAGHLADEDAGQSDLRGDLRGDFRGRGVAPRRTACQNSIP
jgi:hypothetical protein